MYSNVKKCSFLNVDGSCVVCCMWTTCPFPALTGPCNVSLTFIVQRLQPCKHMASSGHTSSFEGTILTSSDSDIVLPTTIEGPAWTFDAINTATAIIIRV